MKRKNLQYCAIETGRENEILLFPFHFPHRGILANSGEIQGNSGEFWGNSGEFWRILGKSDQKLFTSFHSFSFVFPSEKYISLLGKYKSPDFSSGYRENWWKFRGKKVKGNSQGNVNFLSLSFFFPPDPFLLHSTVTKTFMVILNWKNPFVLYGFWKKYSAL